MTDLGLWKEGAMFKTQIERLGLRERNGRNVLVLGSVKIAGEADEIDDGADIGGVDTAAGHRGCRGCVDEVGAGAVRED